MHQVTITRIGKKQQTSHSLPNWKRSQLETAHLTQPSQNQFSSRCQVNHVSPSAIPKTHVAQLKTHQSNTMEVVCLSLSHWARDHMNMLIEMQSLLLQTQKPCPLQSTPTFRPLLLALQMMSRLSLCFLSRQCVSYTQSSPFTDVQVCCTREKLWLLCPVLAFAFRIGCLALTFVLHLHLAFGATQASSVDVHGHMERSFRTKKIHHLSSHPLIGIQSC